MRVNSRSRHAATEGAPLGSRLARRVVVKLLNLLKPVAQSFRAQAFASLMAR
jgi:hypothetical protein